MRFALAPCLLAALLLPTAAPGSGDGPEPPPYLLHEWQVPAQVLGRPAAPSGIAVDSSGSVYVVDLGVRSVQKFDGAGRPLEWWGSMDRNAPLFEAPFGIAVGPDDSVYVTEVQHEEVVRLDRHGREKDRWGGRGTDDGEFRQPAGIAVDEAGDVYVVDSWNHRVQKFSKKGKHRITWGGPGSGRGTFHLPVGIAARNGSVYVADAGNGLVQQFTAGGRFVREWSLGEGEGFWPYAIAVNAAGDVYVSDPEAHCVLHFTGDGRQVSRWAHLEPAPEPDPHRIRVPSGEGSLPRAEGRPLLPATSFAYPVGVAVDLGGDVFVLDRGTLLVKRFRY